MDSARAEAEASGLFGMGVGTMSNKEELEAAVAKGQADFKKQAGEMRKQSIKSRTEVVMVDLKTAEEKEAEKKRESQARYEKALDALEEKEAREAYDKALQAEAAGPYTRCSHSLGLHTVCPLDNLSIPHNTPKLPKPFALTPHELSN